MPAETLSRAAGTAGDAQGADRAGPDSDSVAAPQEASRPGHFRSLVDIGVIVATIGLMFTVATYWVDQRSQEREDRRLARTELTAVTGELTSLYRVYSSGIGAASGPALLDLNSSMATESVVLLAQAEQLVAENPSIVRPSDHYAVAAAHLQVGNYDRAYAAFGLAQEAAGADDYNLALASSRGLASSLFALERPEEARDIFDALVTGDQGGDLPSSVLLANAQFTLVYWARTEAAVGYCAEAANLTERLIDVTLASGRSPNVLLIDELRASIESTCGG